jgi:hypothetical protein
MYTHIYIYINLLQVTGWAHLEMLSNLTPDVFGALTVNGLVGTVLSDVLWAEAGKIEKLKNLKNQIQEIN